MPKLPITLIRIILLAILAGLPGLILTGCQPQNTPAALSGTAAAPAYTSTATSTVLPPAPKRTQTPGGRATRPVLDGEVTLLPSSTPTLNPGPANATAVKTKTPEMIGPFLSGRLSERSVSEIVRSEDGRRIVIRENTLIRWFDTATFAELGSFSVDAYNFIDSISRDGKYLVIAGVLGSSIYNLDDPGKAIGYCGFGAVFSKNSDFVVSRNYDQSSGGTWTQIAINYLTSKKKPLTLPIFHPELTNRLTLPALSPDERWVAAGNSDNLVYIWDVQTGEIQWALKGHADGIAAVAFSPDGRYLVSASEDGTVRFWNPISGSLVRVLTGFVDYPNGLKFLKDGRYLEIHIAGGTQITWDMFSGQYVEQVVAAPTQDPFLTNLLQQGYLPDIQWVVPGPDQNWLALKTADGVLIWDQASAKIVQNLSRPQGLNLVGWAFSPDRLHLAALAVEGSILIWDISAGGAPQQIGFQAAPAGQVYYMSGSGPLIGIGPGIGSGALAHQGLAFSPDSQRLVYGDGQSIAVWNLAQKRQEASLALNLPGSFATDVSFSADGRRLYAVINRNQDAQIWDMETFSLVRQVGLPTVDLNVFTYTALSGPWFARNQQDGDNGLVEVWNLETGKVTRLAAPDAKQEPLRFSADQKLLAAGTSDGPIYFWKIETGELVTIWQPNCGLRTFFWGTDNRSLLGFCEGQLNRYDISALVQYAARDHISPVLPPTQEAAAGLENTPTPQPPLQFSAGGPQVEGALNAQNASQVIEKEVFGFGRLSELAWSPDGRSIFGLGAQGLVAYDAADLKDPNLSPTSNWLNAYSFQPGGRMLAAGSDGNRVKVWEMPEAKLLADLSGSGGAALSPSGEWLAYNDLNGDVQLWNMRTGLPGTSLTRGYFVNPHFSPNSRYLAAASRYGGSVRVWEVASGKIVNALAGSDAVISDFSFSVDGSLAVGASGGTAFIWDLRPGIPPVEIKLFDPVVSGSIYYLNNYPRRVSAVGLSPDNRLAAVGTSLGDIWLYNWKTRQPIRLLQGHSGEIDRVVFSPNGSRLASLDSNGGLFVWEVSSGKLLTTQRDLHAGGISGLVFRQDGDLAAWEPQTSWLVDPQNAGLLRRTALYTGTILAASPVNEWLAVANGFSTQLWNAASGELVQTLEGQAAELGFVDWRIEGSVFRQINSAAFSPDGSVLAAGASGRVFLYEGGTGKLLQTITDFDYPEDIRVSPDNRYLLFSQPIYFGGGPFVVYDLENKAPSSFGFDRIVVKNYAFSPDGSLVASGGQSWSRTGDVFVQSTSAVKGGLSIALAEGDFPQAIAFSPDNRLLALGLSDGRVLLYDLETGRSKANLIGHRAAVTCLAFSVDGRRLATGSEDGTIRFWGLP